VNENHLLGFFTGLVAAEILADKIGTVEIEGKRIHHYWGLVGSLLTDNEFLQGFSIGVGIHDLPDLVDDLDKTLRILKEKFEE